MEGQPRGSGEDNKREKGEEERKQEVRDGRKKLIRKQQLDNFLDYAKANTREMVAYVLLIVGIFLLFLTPLFGQALVGIVAAVYFGNYILQIVDEYESIVEHLGIGRCIILLGLLLTFFITTPALFIAAALTMALKHLIVGDVSK